MIWRRKKSIVNARQQVWFGLEILVVCLGFIILSGFLLFIPPMSDWFGSDEVSSQVLDGLIRVVLLKWPLICLAAAVTFVFGMLMGHRFSGPMFGLEKTIDAWMRGDRTARVRFRKYDYLLPAMAWINSLFQSEQKRLEGIEALVKSIEASSKDEGVRKMSVEILALLKKPQEGG